MLFSIFPLLLLLVAGAGFVLRNEAAQQRLLEKALEVFPVSRSEIEQNIDLVLSRRGTIGVVGLLSLLWSGSGGLSVLATGVSRAWPQTRRRRFVTYRLAAVGIGVLATLLALSVVATTALDLIPQLEKFLFGQDATWRNPPWGTLSSVLPGALALLVFALLYRWVPTDGGWRASLIASLVATVAWRVATWIFVQSLGRGLVRYEHVYGSLGAIAALLFWIYLSALIVLFGAHLCAAIERSSSSTPTYGEVRLTRQESAGGG